ncbi:hypothetical protein A0J51_00312 [Gluconobacter japonicus]|nr:hypothetical protein A0J51_00312 [Gluconobacter japonicus]
MAYDSELCRQGSSIQERRAIALTCLIGLKSTLRLETAAKEALSVVLLLFAGISCATTTLIRQRDSGNHNV